jgi:hypothetical protein
VKEDTDHVKNVSARSEAAQQKRAQLDLKLRDLAQAYEDLATEAWALEMDELADYAIDRHEALEAWMDENG